MLRLFQFDIRIVDVRKMMGGGAARKMEVALLRTKIARKNRENQKEIRDQKRRQDHPDGNVGQVFLMRAQNRHHQQRQEQKRDVGLEITGPDGVGVDGGKVPEVFNLLLDAFVAQGSCATPNGDLIG